MVSVGKVSGSERQLLTSLIHVCCVSKILCMVPFVLQALVWLYMYIYVYASMY